MTTIKICDLLNITPATLRTWYKWYNTKEIDCPELPKPKKTGTKYDWSPDDLGKLIVFKDWMPRGRNGVMGRINEGHWGKK